MSDLIPYTTEELLNLFKASYYEQTGNTLRIGSDEFAFSAVAAYVLRVFEQAIQHGADNYSLDTATGAALDAWASSYNLHRYDMASTARCGLTVTNTTENEITLGVEDIFWENSETEFFNRVPVVLAAGASESVLLWATEGGAKFNGITGITPDPIDGIAFSNISMTYGGADAPLPYSEENDAKFREYIKTHLKTAGFGTATYYEQLALDQAYEEQILTSAYVLRPGDVTQGDVTHSFEPGKVKMFVCFKRVGDDSTQPIGTTAFRTAYINSIRLVLENDFNRCLTDEIVINSIDHIEDMYELGLQNLVVGYKRQFSGLAENGLTVALNHFRKTMQKYRRILVEHIGMDYVEGDVQKLLMTPDEDGVFCSGFNASYSTGTVYKKCPIGKVIFISGWLNPIITYID